MHSSLTALAIVLLFAPVGCVHQRVIPRPSESYSAKLLSSNGPLEFRQYDEALMNQIGERWHGLLGERPPSSVRAGKVVLAFYLHSDGRVTDVKVLENTSDAIFALLCQKAILDCQPYPAWPEPMRKTLDQGYRRVELSFHYD